MWGSLTRGRNIFGSLGMPNTKIGKAQVHDYEYIFNLFLYKFLNFSFLPFQFSEHCCHINGHLECNEICAFSLEIILIFNSLQCCVLWIDSSGVFMWPYRSFGVHKLRGSRFVLRQSVNFVWMRIAHRCMCFVKLTASSDWNPNDCVGQYLQFKMCC